jgi:hypothetical protein
MWYDKICNSTFDYNKALLIQADKKSRYELKYQNSE